MSETFTADETSAWEAERRRNLRAGVRTASPIAVALLARARATPGRLLALSAREVRHVDWRAGFLNPCTIVVRPAGSPAGRLGAWERGGHLCVEAEVGGVVLVLDGPRGEIRLRPGSVRAGTTVTPARLRSFAAGSLARWRGSVGTPWTCSRSGSVVIPFRTSVRGFTLA